MTEAEQIVNQERTILEQRAIIAEQKARITQLTSMHQNDQRHIDTLQRVIDRKNNSEAARVFK